MSEIYDKFKRIDEANNSLLTPFVVSKEKRVLYFHIAKTGGSSIVHSLREQGFDDGVLSDKWLPFNAKMDYFTEVAENWNSFYKFTFVRNKYDLLVSLFHYNKDHSKRVGRRFDRFITEYVVPSKDEYDYWIDQYYLTHEKDKPIFDFIGRFENYDEDWQKVCKRIGISNVTRRDNVGSYDHSIPFGDYYTGDLAQMVYDKFKKEIDHFGFDLR